MMFSMNAIRNQETKCIKKHDPICVFYHFGKKDVCYLLEQDREDFYSKQVTAWHEQGAKIRAMEDATDGERYNHETPTDDNGRWGLVVATANKNEMCPLAFSKGLMIEGPTYWFKNKQDRDDCVTQSQKYSKFCAVCLKTSTKRCNACGKVRYCSRECQKIHWKTHKKQCGKWKEEAQY
jgi:hypothetical protein